MWAPSNLGNGRYWGETQLREVLDCVQGGNYDVDRLDLVCQILVDKVNLLIGRGIRYVV